MPEVELTNCLLSSAWLRRAAQEKGLPMHVVDGAVSKGKKGVLFMTATPMPTSSIKPGDTNSLVAMPAEIVQSPKVQPLWRFALVGLGPLTALAILACLVTLFQRVA
jgi:hypothetical protein